MKTCFKCGRELPVEQFYKHPRMADGRLNKCKKCTQKDVMVNRIKREKHYRDYERKRALTPKRKKLVKAYAKENPAIVNAAKRRWAEKNKFKRSAETAVTNAVRDGKLEKKPCLICGSTTRIHGHHEDYTKPLDVIWLCPKHHSILHYAKRILSEKKS